VSNFNVNSILAVTLLFFFGNVPKVGFTSGLNVYSIFHINLRKYIRKTKAHIAKLN